MGFPWRRRRREEDLEAEIRAHLEMAMRDRMECGASPEEAGYAVGREFGNVGNHRMRHILTSCPPVDVARCRPSGEKARAVTRAP